MNIHKNASMTPKGPARWVKEIARIGLKPAAAAAGLSTCTARKWQRRFIQHGAGALADRSSRPHCSPARSVVHPGTLAVVEDALVAKARVTPKHDAHLRPGLAQPAHQQFQNRRSMPGPIDAAGPQGGAQQLLAAEHVQRKIAVAVVVALKEAPLLLAVQRIVGGVKVYHPFFGSVLKLAMNCSTSTWCKRQAVA